MRVGEVLPCNSMLVLAESLDRWRRDGPIKQALPRTASLRYEHRGRGVILNFSSTRWPSPLLTPSALLFIASPPHLHQLVAWARRLVVLYCVLRGPVHRHGPDQAAAANLKEVYEVPDAAVTEETQAAECQSQRRRSPPTKPIKP